MAAAFKLGRNIVQLNAIYIWVIYSICNVGFMGLLHIHMQPKDHTKFDTSEVKKKKNFFS